MQWLKNKNETITSKLPKLALLDIRKINEIRLFFVNYLKYPFGHQEKVML